MMEWTPPPDGIAVLLVTSVNLTFVTTQNQTLLACR